MAYDGQRTFARPALQTVMHVEHDGRQMYGRQQSIGFQYTNQPPVLRGGFVSSPPSRVYAPAGLAGPSRRPLPTPRTRPESMPPPLRESPLIVQAPAPSRPAILAPSATLATSPTVPPVRRPLPTPALPQTTKHNSIDLTARPTSPVKSSINTQPDRDLRIPSSFSRRTAPIPDVPIHRPPPVPAAPFSTPPPTWSRSPFSDAHQTQQSKSAQLRNGIPAPVGTNVIERRSTVSGVVPPIVLPRRAESPERTLPAHSLPSRRPLPSSPIEPPRVPSLHQRVPASSEDENDISSPSDISSLSDQDPYEPITFADPMQAEDVEHDAFARNAHTPSPQYGIRDLPTRSRIAIANRDDSQNANTGAQQDQTTRPRAVRSATLPQPPTPGLNTPQSQPRTTSLPQSPQERISPPVSTPFTPFSNRSPSPGSSTTEPQSLTLRFASMGLAEERKRERQTQQSASNPTPAQSPSRAVHGPTSPVRQQHGWPANVPPLPPTPGNATRPFFGTTDVPSEFTNIDINNTSCMPLPPSSKEPAVPAKQDIFTIYSIVTNQPNTPFTPFSLISKSQRHV